MSDATSDHGSATSDSDLNDIFTAETVHDASAKLETLLNRPGHELDDLPPDVNDSRGRKRVVDGEDENLLFFKTIRQDDKSGCDSAIDIFVESVTALLAEELNYPVPRVRMVEHEKEGIGLVSRYLDGDQGAQEDPSTLANYRQLQDLQAFELWVLNYDDQDRHFRTVDTDHGRERWCYDHGHALHRALDVDVEDVEDYESIANMGRHPENYGVESAEDVRNGINRIENVTDDIIDDCIERALQWLQELETDHDHVKRFLKEADHHEWAAKHILKTRRVQIDEICEYRLGT